LLDIDAVSYVDQQWEKDRRRILVTRLSRPSPASPSPLASEFTEKTTPLDPKGYPVISGGLDQ
jgi:hypothetical protein